MIALRRLAACGLHARGLREGTFLDHEGALQGLAEAAQPFFTGRSIEARSKARAQVRLEASLPVQRATAPVVRDAAEFVHAVAHAIGQQA